MTNERQAETTSLGVVYEWITGAIELFKNLRLIPPLYANAMINHF
jgi:hypothetical protein